jgi:hypothetical protein
MLRWLLWWRPPCERRRVLINLSDNRELLLEGILWSVRGPWFTLRAAAEIHPFVADEKKQRLPLDHEVMVHRSNVSWLQVLP